MIKSKETTQIQKVTFFMVLMLLSMNFEAFNQASESNEPPERELLNAAREIMTSATSCALITVDQEGCPRVRAMDPFIPESDFTVWFGTNAKSRKVDQIKKNPKVTLYYLEDGDSGYVMIHGKAQLIDDQKEKDKRWKEEWEAFYPNKSKEYLLIKVTPEWLELISYSHGIVGDPVSWEPPAVVFENHD